MLQAPAGIRPFCRKELEFAIKKLTSQAEGTWASLAPGPCGVSRRSGLWTGPEGLLSQGGVSWVPCNKGKPHKVHCHGQRHQYEGLRPQASTDDKQPLCAPALARR